MTCSQAGFGTPLPHQVTHKSRRSQKRHLDSPGVAPAPVRPKNTHQGLRASTSVFSAHKSSGSAARGGQGTPLLVRVAAEPRPPPSPSKREVSAAVANQASTCHLGFLPPAPGPC